jgi:predicted acylesterase/phospholipase RssA
MKLKHTLYFGLKSIGVLGLSLTTINILLASEVKEEISQLNTSTINYPINYETPFTEEELKDAIDIPAGVLVAPSEKATSQFIEQEGLNLLETGQQASTKAKPRIGLSIDGGGIRGVMSAIWLRNLSIAYQEDPEFGLNPRLYKVFDYVGGTSIGGIVALGVAADLTPEVIVDLFDKHGKEIFSTEGRKLARFGDFFGLFSYRYSSHNLENLMKETFLDLTLEDANTNILITACTDNGHPWLFKKEDSKNYKLWEVARSTSAAPTYFESYKPSLLDENRKPILMQDEKTKNIINKHESLVDGGIWVNNPTTLVTASMVRYFNGGTFDPNKLYMLSLGTGDTEAKAIPQSAGKLHAAAILEALMNSHNRGNHMLMSQLLAEDHYYRINPELERFIDLSDAKSIKELKSYAERDEHKAQIKKFVENTKEIVRAKLEQD